MSDTASSYDDSETMSGAILSFARTLLGWSGDWHAFVEDSSVFSFRDSSACVSDGVEVGGSAGGFRRIFSTFRMSRSRRPPSRNFSSPRSLVSWTGFVQQHWESGSRAQVFQYTWHWRYQVQLQNWLSRVRHTRDGDGLFRLRLSNSLHSCWKVIW